MANNASETAKAEQTSHTLTVPSDVTLHLSSGARMEIGSYPIRGEENIVFVSTDINGSPGELSESVLFRLEADFPKLDIRRLIRDGFETKIINGVEMPFVVTIAEDAGNEELLDSNFRAALSAAAEDRRWETRQLVWLALMGSGAGGIDQVKSLEIILDAIVDNPELGQYWDYRIALPPNVTEKQAELLLDTAEGMLASYTATDPAPSDAPRITDATGFLDDLPAEQDDLDRRHIASTIVNRVREVWPSQRKYNRPFIVHLSGRWGSGKSSILNFLKQEMTSDDPGPNDWVIVDYNAWKHNGETEVWWSLLNALVRNAPSQLDGPHGFWLWFEDKIWRFFTGWWTYLFGGLLILGLVWALVLTDPQNGTPDARGTVTTTTVVEGEPATTSLEVDGKTIDATEKIREETRTVDAPKTFSNRLKDFGGQVTAIIGLIGLLGQFYNRRTRTAEAIKALDTDPTAPLHDRYKKVVQQIARPVAIFIDDLDRCDAKFVVTLLQAVQNVYSDVPVLYVVAADRDWVVSAYSQVYRGFRTDMSEPGRPLGHLFVEKIFQLSVNVPDLGHEQQRRYLDSKLGTTAKPSEADAAALSAIETQVADAGDDLDRLREILDEQTNPVLRQRAAELSFQTVTSASAETALQHRLSEFAELMDPNPRAIKRLINAYAFRYGFAFLSGYTDVVDILPRWSILDLRFPYAAKRLAERPELVDTGKWREDEKLFPDPELIAAILGDLTSEDIEYLRRFG